ncbi:Dam family site-specific DNA-(adenine-N6)-methyltransferase [Alicyclobacillus vulcanalis]|uniref:Site-specific DNA-methyltransferase (adenine-specific) n=1 Tax=Alicyclobacillus vulcanalis TaxID=252246 RepID=A0A1N7JJ89_9BACL|nr:Dam family site-specific DNA-(adenine-N6)-methyltransferase [Alicyclobacillus vulcanalis]SIS49399.1 DNA adenine methylase [Alicyclobacillus vulcanalis]
MKPFLKWAGGKYRLLPYIQGSLPQGKRLIEPFVGSGAVFLNTNYDAYVLSDINADVIALYRTLTLHGEAFIAECRRLFIPENNTAEAYYALRDEFNATCEPVRRAALFVYLNRHGYNGLCRYNADGRFNVPFGRYKRPYFPEREMRYFYEKARRAEFLCLDFREVMRMAEPGDVVYCDPPYVPLSKTANFRQYAALGFGEAEQRDLARIAEELAERGIPVLVSNHLTPFTVREYQRATCQPLQVRRAISCVGARRGYAPEVLALFTPTSR